MSKFVQLSDRLLDIIEYQSMKKAFSKIINIRSKSEIIRKKTDSYYDV